MTTNYKTPNEWDEVFGDEPIPDDPKSPKSYVYLIAVGKFVKIGWSKKPRARLTNIRCASPYPVEMIATFEYPNDAAFGAEAFVHKQLRRYRRRGEWFALTPDHAESELKRLLLAMPDSPFRSLYDAACEPPRRAPRKRVNERDSV